MDMEKVSRILLIAAAILTTTLAKDSELRFGLITHNSAEIFVTPPCEKAVVEYRNTRNGETANVIITKPPYATRITGLQPATEYQVRIRTTNYKDASTSQLAWNEGETFTTDLFAVFGRVALLSGLQGGDFENKNSLAWNSSLTSITQSYSTNALPYKDIEIIRILQDSSKKPVVHYRFKLEELSNLTRYKLTGPEFEDSLIHSRGTPDGTPYVFKEGNEVILFYTSNTKCFSLIERYMVVSRDDGTTSDIHLNVAESTATSPSEEDGLLVTREGDLVRDDSRSVGRLKADTLVMLTPKFLILDCHRHSTLPIYSEVYGATDYVTNQPAPINYEYIEPKNASMDSVDLRIRRGRNRTVLFVPPVQNAVKYEIWYADKIITTVEGSDLKCRHETKVVLQGFADSKSYTITLIVVVLNKIGERIPAIKQSVFIRTEKCPIPRLQSNLRLRHIVRSKRKIYFQCGNRTRLRGPRYAVCKQNRWTEFPTCEEECAMPHLQSNLRLTSSSPSRILYFACTHGTQMKGKNYAVCDRSGRWTKFPTCEEIPRPCRVPLVRNSVTPRRYRLIFTKGETIRYTCRDGFVLRGHNNLTCMGVHWNKPKPSCIRMTCHAPALYPHVSRQGRRQIYEVGAGIVFNCDVGYKMEGSSTLKCQNNGTWSSKPPRCIKKKLYCVIPHRLLQVSLFTPAKDFYNESDVIRYRCHQGYAPYRSMTSMCLANGQWSTKLPQCKKLPVSCTSSNLQRRWIRPERYFPVGYRIVFGCPRGYRIYGSYTTHCLPSGLWSFAKPVCYVDRRLFNFGNSFNRDRW